MQREILITKDGSTTIYLPEINESYHSKHGAVQEAYHVFINMGLNLFSQNTISILEMGFGTGLNAFITFLETQENNKSIDYVGVEAYPVINEEVKCMNFVKELQATNQETIFDEMHQCTWNEKHFISNNFCLTKRQQLFEDITDENCYDLIYFDAFGFAVQPSLWNEELFAKMYKSLKSKGVLVTYACRTSIKNAMLSSGFSVEKLPGAPGKREMLRATKN